MKIWYGFGSEHSTNLVMIGRFKEAKDAIQSKEIFDQLARQVKNEVDVGQLNVGDPTYRYSDAMLTLLSQLNVHSVGPGELEQFEYDVNIEVKDKDIVITTDEIDVSVFMKILIDRGARIEVFSKHDYPES